MALEKSEVNDKLEIVDTGSWKVLQVRTATIIKEDGTELSRNFSRRVIVPTDSDMRAVPDPFFILISFFM